MTDIIKVTEITQTIPDFRNYIPDWSKDTMNTVNEMMAQFYGWLPDVSIPTTPDYVTWGLLTFIALVLLFKK